MKQNRAGFTFMEVMIASAIMIVVFIVIYATFDTADTSYRNEGSLRSAQLMAQQKVDEFVTEAAETGRNLLWVAPLTITPSNPTGLQKALVYLSARDNTTKQYTLAGLNPDWQNTVVIVPLPAVQGGTYELVRFEMPEPTAAQVAVAANTTVSVTGTDVYVNFYES
jgi:Tfp pilus assembly protein PilE